MVVQCSNNIPIVIAVMNHHSYIDVIAAMTIYYSGSLQDEALIFTSYGILSTHLNGMYWTNKAEEMTSAPCWQGRYNV